MNQSDIGITEYTYDSSTNFDTSEHCCEILTALLINGETLYFRETNNKARGGVMQGRSGDWIRRRGS